MTFEYFVSKSLFFLFLTNNFFLWLILNLGAYLKIVNCIQSNVVWGD